jgi:hypothetical protein
MSKTLAYYFLHACKHGSSQVPPTFCPLFTTSMYMWEWTRLLSDLSNRHDTWNSINRTSACLCTLHHGFFWMPWLKYMQVVNSVKQVNPYCLPVSLFDKLLTSHRHIISSFIFKSKFFCFIATVRGFENCSWYQPKHCSCLMWQNLKHAPA